VPVCYNRALESNNFLLSHNHLCNSLTSQRLTALELLSLDAGQRVERGREEQDDRGGDQGCRVPNERQPLDDGHDQVDGGTRVVRVEATDELIEFRGGRADSQEQRNFYEEDDEGAYEADHAPEDDDVEVEDVRYAEREAQDHAEHAGPLPVYTEISRPEFVGERHVV